MTIAMTGCDKKSVSPNNTSLSTGVVFSLKNEQGEDLLDPKTENYLNEDNINLYYLDGDNKIRQYDGSKDFPKNFRILKDQAGRNILEVFLNYNGANGEISTTILEYPNYELDQIAIKLGKTENSTYFTDIWINGEKIDLNDQSALANLELVKVPLN